MAKNENKPISLGFIVPLLFLAFCLFIYLHNLTVDIYGGDVGDLVTASYVFGVAHPPGYPLFTFLGFLLSHLPLSIPVVSKVGLISVFASVGTLFVFYRLAYGVTKSIFLSLLSTSIIAFSYLFWFYTELPEVFALNCFLSALLLFASIRFYEMEKQKYLFLAALVAGLGLTNHQTIVLLFPGVAILILLKYKWILRNKVKVLLSFLIFAIALLPYIYVPVAASTNPIVNWDKATNLDNFLQLVLRQDYGTFSAAAFRRANIFEQVLVIQSYFLSLISSLTFPGFIIAVIGFFYALFKKRSVTLVLLLTFILAGPFFIFYAGFPLLNTFIQGVSERFYVLSLLILALFIPYGFMFLKSLFERFLTKKELVYVILLAFLVIPLMLFKANFVKTDLSNATLGNKLSMDILKIMPADGVVFLTGDTTVFNTWYVRYVLNVRPDVDLVQFNGNSNDEFMRERIASYQARHPEKKAPEAFVGALLELSEERPVFITSPIDFPSDNITSIPWGLALQPVDKKFVPDEKTYLARSNLMWKDINPPVRDKLSISERNLTYSFIPSQYANALARAAAYISEQYDNTPEAIRYYEWAIKVDPNFSRSYAGLAALQYEKLRDCKKSEDNILKAINLNPVDRNYYLLLYLLYSDCYRDEKKAQDFRAFFKNKFKTDIGSSLSSQDIDL